MNPIRGTSHKYFNNELSKLIQTETNLMKQTVGDIDIFQYLWGERMRLIDFKNKDEILFISTQDRMYRNLNGIKCEDGAIIESYKVKCDSRFENNLIYSFTENKRKTVDKDTLIKWLEFKIEFNDIDVEINDDDFWE